MGRAGTGQGFVPSVRGGCWQEGGCARADQGTRPPQAWLRPQMSPGSGREAVVEQRVGGRWMDVPAEKDRESSSHRQEEGRGHGD